MVFSLAAETGWSEERIMFMPLSLLTQYRHCLLRRNCTRTVWSSVRGLVTPANLIEHLSALKSLWMPTVDSNPDT